ncbi:MAG: beta-Ala-His dipeptidase [Halieaceae bacterium]
MKPEHYPMQPAHLWEHFYQITRIPRPSKEEMAVRQYVIDQAEAAGHAWQMDAQGNLVIRVPGSAGMESNGTVIIQNHLDMVTVKTEDKEHNFSTDPLSLQVNDGWLLADRTTLGADNGVGCAAALAVMTDTEVAHPPLELLFTVDEETGLGGALNLDAGLLTGTRMLNLDTEDWNELYIGCAGGGGWHFERQFEQQALPDSEECWSLSLKGLAGGHSGIEIHHQLANAIKLLAQALDGIDGLRLAGFDAGVAHNVIPREASAVFACTPGQGDVLAARLPALRESWLGYLPAADNGLEFVLSPAIATMGLTEPDTARVCGLISLMPHGPQAYSLEQPADLVDLSINLARLTLTDGLLFVESSFRFFNEQQSLPLQRTVLDLAALFELTVTPDVGYPGWQPDFSSKLLAQGIALHERLFGFEPAVKAIHAGLECGILKGKKTDLDILSFGPTIRGAHSPTERLEISTVTPFWQLLTTLLAEM